MPRQAGVLLPLFSLRSASDWGVGEIPDLVPWARWCASAGFSLAMVLPVNEASRGQNSPYAALSAFAIDPVYVALGAMEDFEAAGGVEALSADDRALLEKVRAAPTVRWDEVRALKRRALSLAFDRFEREEWARRITHPHRIPEPVRHALGQFASPTERPSGDRDDGHGRPPSCTARGRCPPSKRPGLAIGSSLSVPAGTHPDVGDHSSVLSFWRMPGKSASRAVSPSCIRR